MLKSKKSKKVKNTEGPPFLIFSKKKQKHTPKDGFCCSINLKEDEIQD
jgi:hypothetical protein